MSAAAPIATPKQPPSHCDHCGAPMTLAKIEPHPEKSGYLRVFECSRCHLPIVTYTGAKFEIGNRVFVRSARTVATVAATGLSFVSLDQKKPILTYRLSEIEGTVFDEEDLELIEHEQDAEPNPQHNLAVIEGLKDAGRRAEGK